MASILLVEDEKLLRWSLQQRLEREGHVVYPAENLAAALGHLAARQPDLLLLDLSLPDGNGLDFFEANRERLEDSVVVVMTAFGQVEDAVRAMKLGALDFLSKPVDHRALVELVNRSLEVRRVQRDAEVAQRIRERDLDVDLVCHSRTFARTLEIAEEVARSPVDTVLLVGESGTGKNVVARYIHAVSPRHGAPFLEVNCAAIPGSLMESELFGHERGSFTDAKTTHKGTFELADGGSVLLDEVGDLRLDLQAKLLHLLDRRTFRRVGGSREIRVDVRVLAATNRNLREMVQNKEFRDDLYYRISTFPIEIPPLRERPEDIVPLAKQFLRSLQQRMGKRFDGFTREAENVLLSYRWPGNVRELRNVVERAVILTKGRTIGVESLVLDCVPSAALPTDTEIPAAGGVGAEIMPLDALEREMVRRAMTAAGGNQTRAARMLGISRDQLRYRLKKLEE